MQQWNDDGDCIHALCTCTYAVHMHEYSLVGSFPLLEKMSWIQGYSQGICT